MHIKLVASILLPWCWRQQIGWSYCAASRTFSLMAWRKSEKTSLCQEHSVLLVV